jgi:hypothetical protein
MESESAIDRWMPRTSVLEGALKKMTEHKAEPKPQKGGWKKEAE